MKLFDTRHDGLVLIALTLLAGTSAGSGASRLLAQQPRILAGHTNAVLSVAFSPDGRTLASGGRDMTVRLWDVETGKTRTQIVTHDTLYPLPPDHLRRADLSVEQIVEDIKRRNPHSPNADFTKSAKYVLKRLQENKASGYEGDVQGVMFSPDGNTLAAVFGGMCNQLALYDTGTGRQQMLIVVDDNPFLRAMREFRQHGTRPPFFGGGAAGGGGGGLGGIKCPCVAFSFDGKEVASGNMYDGSVKVWDTKGRLHATLPGHRRGVAWVAFLPRSPSSARHSRAASLISADPEGNLRLWSVQGRKMGEWNVKTHFQGPPGKDRHHHPGGPFSTGLTLEKVLAIPIRCMAVSPDGKTLALGGREGTTCLWDLDKHRMKRLEVSDLEVMSVAFSPDGKMLAWATGKAARLWDIQKDKLIDTIGGHEDLVTSVAFSPDGETLATGSWDKKVRLWNLSKLTSKPSELTPEPGAPF